MRLRASALLCPQIQRGQQVPAQTHTRLNCQKTRSVVFRLLKDQRLYIPPEASLAACRFSTPKPCFKNSGGRAQVGVALGGLFPENRRLSDAVFIPNKSRLYRFPQGPDWRGQLIRAFFLESESASHATHIYVPVHGIWTLPSCDMPAVHNLPP